MSPFSAYNVLMLDALDVLFIAVYPDDSDGVISYDDTMATNAED